MMKKNPSVFPWHLKIPLLKGLLSDYGSAGGKKQPKVDQFGKRFTVDIPVVGPKGEGVVTTGWIYKTGSSVPEMTTILVKRSEGKNEVQNQ